MKKIILCLGLICLILLLIGCQKPERTKFVCPDGSTVYNSWECPKPEYKYQKSFWVGTNWKERDQTELCNQRFASEYGTSNFECEVQNQMINLDYSNEGKTGSVKCVCRY